MAEFDFQTSGAALRAWGSGVVGKFCVPVQPWEKLMEQRGAGVCLCVLGISPGGLRRGKASPLFIKDFHAGQARFAFLMVEVP